MMRRAHPFRAGSLAAQLFALEPGASCVRPDDAKERRACARAIADIREHEPSRDYSVTHFLMVFGEEKERPSKRMLCVTRTQ